MEPVVSGKWADVDRALIEARAAIRVGPMMSPSAGVGRPVALIRADDSAPQDRYSAIRADRRETGGLSP